MNDSLMMAFQGYGALTVIAMMWDSDPFDFVVGLLDVDADVELLMEAASDDDDPDDEE